MGSIAGAGERASLRLAPTVENPFTTRRMPHGGCELHTGVYNSGHAVVLARDVHRSSDSFGGFGVASHGHSQPNPRTHRGFFRTLILALLAFTPANIEIAPHNETQREVNMVSRRHA